jgi:kynurenine 3-monooxygenase
MDRNWLNDRLLTESDRTNNIFVVFEHKLLRCDVSKGLLTFLYKGKEKTVTADIIVGADGVYSQVRTGIMKAVKMDFEQHYIDCMWCELEISPSPTPTEWNGYKMIPERLHIWPRGNFMLIALPNNVSLFIQWLIEG